MKIYVDFDGVILDTDSILDMEYSKVKDVKRSDFVKNYDWEKLVNNATIINSSLYNLKHSKQDIYILSKISSMNEAIAKVRYLRDSDVFANIYFVPTQISKSDVVIARGNILIDDKIYNLEQWEEKGGIPIFFNKDNQDYDVRGNKNIKYKKIFNLDILTEDNINKFIGHN